MSLEHLFGERQEKKSDAEKESGPVKSYTTEAAENSTVIDKPSESAPVNQALNPRGDKKAVATLFGEDSTPPGPTPAATAVLRKEPNTADTLTQSNESAIPEENGEPEKKTKKRGKTKETVGGKSARKAASKGSDNGTHDDALDEPDVTAGSEEAAKDRAAAIELLHEHIRAIRDAATAVWWEGKEAETDILIVSGKASIYIARNDPAGEPG